MRGGRRPRSLLQALAVPSVHSRVTERPVIEVPRHRWITTRDAPGYRAGVSARVGLETSA